MNGGDDGAITDAVAVSVAGDNAIAWPGACTVAVAVASPAADPVMWIVMAIRLY